MERRLTGLDGLRGIAALVVLVMHVSSGLQGGHLAVDFFFMLSGYVMARAYEARLQQGDIAPRSFVAARFRRFWPTMAAGATIGVVATAMLSGPSPTLAVTYLAALLLIPSSATAPYVLNLPAWSIFYELLANTAHAFGFSRFSTRSLAILLLVSGAGLIIATVVVGFPRILSETSPQMQALVIFRLLFSYIIGIIIFRVVKDKQPVRLPFTLGFVLLPLYVLAILIWPFPGWQFLFIVALAPVMIVCGLDEHAPERLCTVLGKLSFPLYALHFPVMQLAVASGVQNPGLVIIASIAVSTLWLAPWNKLAWPRPAGAAAAPGL